MPRVNAYWLGVTALWMLAIGLTFWNLSAIEAISTTRNQSERLRNELLFHRQYTGKLESVRQTADSYTLPVDSANLGFLAVQNRLETLGAIFGLTEFKVRRQVGATTPGQCRLTVSCAGFFENALAFMQALEKIPYLPVSRTQLTMEDHDALVSAKIDLVFHFRIGEPSDDPSIPVQASGYAMSGEEHPS